MPGIKRLIPRLIAVVGVAAVALALLPSPAAADHTTKVDKSTGNVCGYSESKYKYDSNGDLVTEQDADGNQVPVLGPTKFLMKFNSQGVCADNTDLPGGKARPMTGSSTSASTIALIYAGHGSRTGRTLANWCINTMFQNAARVPYSGTTNYDDDTDTATYVDPDGSSGNTIYIHRQRHLPSNWNTLNPEQKQAERTHDANDRVLDFQDLVAGAHFCASGKL